jgi:molybdopterin-guanine dinucleotide biosynthesis protein A
VTPDVVVIANDPALRAALAAPGRRVIGDVRAERGSLIGLYTALAAGADAVLVVAWDMPFVTAALLALIAERLVPPIDAVIPETSHGLEPLCAAYARNASPYVEGAIDRGRMRLSDLVADLPVVRRIGASELAPAGDPERLFFNVNTPADLVLAERMARGG